MNIEVFDQNLTRLENIFGKKVVAYRIRRLREIFYSTECTWQNNLDRFRDKEIKNILIAESAPWSDSGTPRYFYNQIESNYHKRI